MEQLEEIPIPEIEEKAHKKLGKWRLTAGVAAAALAIIIAAAIIFIKIYYSEERALIKGLLNLAEEMEMRQQLWEEASGNERDDPFGCVKMSTVLNVSSEELPVTLGVDTILLRDSAVRRTQALTEISIMNNKLLTVTLDGQEEDMMLAVPVFFRQNLAFDAAHIEEQYNDSLLAEKFGKIEGTELSINLFPKWPKKIWQEYYVNLMEKLRNAGNNKEAEGIEEIEIEKLETPLVINVPERDDKQYQCSQYRVTISYREGNAKDSLVFLTAVDENDRIVQISLEEPLTLSMKYKEDDIDVKVDGSVCFLGEARTIDDIVVDMQMEIPLLVPKFGETLLSAFGNELIDKTDKEDIIAIQAGAELIYDENDSSVTTDINRLTVTVDRIGGFKVSGKVITEPLREPIEALAGETIRIFEITEAQYQDLEKQFLQRIWRWLKAAGWQGLQD
ncbi:MAG: hypothetical protein NC314_08880 [Roseburia sp.]|nr:hypothetical protein [Roseburia sp.]MCM1242941.1 hypothetical protein [Roseburia sp.]